MPRTTRASPGSECPLPPSEARSVPATVLGYAGAPPSPGERTVPEEVAIEVRLANVSFAVMMLTPADLHDFALGFLLTEGIAAAGEVRGVIVEDHPQGLRLTVDLAPAALHRALARRRALAARTSCGVCGVEDFAALARDGSSLAEPPAIRPEAVRRALGSLDAATPLARATRATHAAAFADADGTLLAVREDVGRHNALDKLIGALVRGGIGPGRGFVVVTSRASYEMVEKVAAFGGAILVAISAPTSLAVDRARHHGMTLACLARHDTMTVFAGLERVRDRVPA